MHAALPRPACYTHARTRTHARACRRTHSHVLSPFTTTGTAPLVRSLFSHALHAIGLNLVAHRLNADRIRRGKQLGQNSSSAASVASLRPRLLVLAFPFFRRRPAGRLYPAAVGTVASVHRMPLVTRTVLRASINGKWMVVRVFCPKWAGSRVEGVGRKKK